MLLRRFTPLLVLCLLPALAGAAEEDQPFVLGNGAPKFDPPPLAELLKLTWVDGPVRDGIEMMREEQERKGPPQVTAAEALALRNDSAENNEKILDALGRMAPADGTGVDYDGVIVRQVVGDMNSTNPLFQSSVSDMEFADLTGFGIIGFDREFKYFASKDSVVSWQTTDDAMIDKFVLRDDLSWSDGKPITAYDIEFSYQLIMSDHDQLVIPAVKQGTDKLLGVKAYDDHTIAFFHKEPLATRIPNMIFPILPKHIYEKSVYEDPSLRRSAYHTDQEEHPVVGGAYELAKRVRGQEFVMRRRESYYMHDGKQVRPKPYPAEVRVKVIEDMNTALLALKAGDIHAIELRSEQWESQTDGNDFYAKNTKVTAPEWTEFHFEWNNKSRFFSDKRVRWAMSYAMDYDELINTICRGLYQQSRGPFHPDSWMFPKNGPAPMVQDLDKAEDLLDEAGWTDSDGDGIRDKVIDGKLVPFEFQLMTSQTETGVQVATLMKECLEQIGVAVNVKPTEFVVMQEKLQKHEFDATFGGWGTGTDPDTHENTTATGKERNYGQYSNPEVDRLYVEGRKELDKAKRAEIYAKIHALMWEDQPQTWLFYRNAFFGFNKKLRGYTFSPRGPFSFSPGFSGIYCAEAIAP